MLTPIDFAFLDSGTGGLPYMIYLKEACPDASCIYVADTYNFPYGEKTVEQIQSAAFSAVSAILNRYDPAVIILACNTISVTALSFLRETFPAINFVGTVPAIKLAAKCTKNKRIGLLATAGTIAHEYTKQLSQTFAAFCHVAKRADPELINFIEHDLNSATVAEIQNAIRPAMNFFIHEKVDIIILGCTHFLHVAEAMQEYVNTCARSIKIIDSRHGVVRQAMKIVKKAPSTRSAFILKDKSRDKLLSVFYITGREPHNGFYEKIASTHGICYRGKL